MLTINVAATDTRSVVNEDVVGHCGNAAWVIDGATGVGASLIEEPSDAAWLARTIDMAFRDLLHADPNISTLELVRRTAIRSRDAVVSGATRIAEGAHEHPSAAFAMVRRCEDHVELSGLADCRIAFRDERGEARLFGDTSLDAVEDRTLALTRQILTSHPDIEPAALFERLRPQLRANRQWMNRPGGYWVLSTEPSAADHLVRLVLPLRAGQRFAIASDGFLRLVEPFRLATPAKLLEIDSVAAWNEWLSRLREMERRSDSCRSHPRVKVHDDATFLNLEL